MTPYKRIFIIGHSGAGKTLIAKMLAERIGWNFIDADFGLEARVGRFLSEIVGKPEGVESFLNCQTQILKNQLTQEHIVVATDSSLLASAHNEKLLSSEFVVYLKVSTSIQLKRLLRASGALLIMEDHTAFLDAMHNERDEVYERAATLTIESDDSDVNKHISLIIKSLAVNEPVTKSN